LKHRVPFGGPLQVPMRRCLIQDNKDRKQVRILRVPGYCGGLAPEQVASAFLASDEFYNRASR